MKPYYQDSAVTIYHGDCREILPTLDIKNALLIADPPYGETSLKWDRWPASWPEAAAEAASAMWCFGSFRMFMRHWPQFGSWNFSQDIVWEKHNGTGAHTDRFRRIHEMAAFFYRVGVPWADVYKAVPHIGVALKKRIIRRQQPSTWRRIGGSTFNSDLGGPRLMTSVIYCRSAHGATINPCQKPTALVLPLIQYGCPPQGKVVELFMGSGSAIRAAKDSGRTGVGIEADERQCEASARRMQQEVLALA